MKLADFVENFRSQKKKKNAYYRRSQYMPTASEVAARIDYYDTQGEGLLDYQKSAVKWILDGKIRLICDQMGIHCYREVIFCLPSKKAGTIIVYNKDDFCDWTNEIDKYRPDLSYTAITSSKDFRFPKPGEVTIVSWDKLPSPAIFDEQKISPYILVLGDAHYAKNPKTKRRRRIQPFVERAKTLIAQTFHLNTRNPGDYYEILELMRVNPFNMSLSTFRSRYWEDDQTKAKDAYDRFTPKLELEEFLQTFMMQRDPRYTATEFPPIRRTEKILSLNSDDEVDLNAKDPKYISALKLPYVQDLADSYRFYECKTIIMSRYSEILDKISARRLKSDEDLRKEPVFTATHREFMGLYLRIIDTPQRKGPLTIVRMDLDISEEVNEYNMSRIRRLASRRCKNGSIEFIDIKDIKWTTK